jgi:predicted nucleic acid-binding protein
VGFGLIARKAIKDAGAMYGPDCLRVETFAALRKMWVYKTITDQAFKEAVTTLQETRYRKLPSSRLLGRAYELRHNVGAYDAMYVALAEILQCPLITTDVRLANAAGVRCEIELLAA